MSEGKAMRDQFVVCHDELVARGEKLEWKALRADARYVALLEKEVELARSANDATFYELCFDDVGELTAEVHDARYEVIERVCSLFTYFFNSVLRRLCIHFFDIVISFIFS